MSSLAVAPTSGPTRALSRRRRLPAILIGLVLFITACGGGDSDGDGSPGGENPEPPDRSLILAEAADTRSLYASSSTAQREINISEQMNEKLIEFSADGQDYEPRLATEWEQVDPVTTRLTLREGVTFTNGEAFDSATAKFSIDTMLAAPAYASFTSSIATAEIVDEFTIDVIAKQPSGLILTSLAMGSFQYPPAYFAEVGEEAYASAPIGTGPYVLVEWQKGVAVTLEANPDYWDGEPFYTDVEFRIIPDKAAQVAALRSGQVDFVPDLPIGSIGEVEGADDLALLTQPSNRVYYATFTTLQEGPLQDPAVRRALQYAIDVDAIINGVLDGHATPLAGQIVTGSFFGFNPDLEPTPYDPELAMEMLAEAGYPDGFTMQLQYSATNIQEVGQAVALQLAEVGIDVQQDVLEPGTFLQRLVAKELVGMFYAGSLPPPDAHFMYQQFRSDFRYSYYSDPEVDRLIDEGLASADPEDRQQAYSDLTEAFTANPPFIPLFQSEDVYGVTNTLSGFEPRVSQFLDLKAWS